MRCSFSGHVSVGKEILSVPCIVILDYLHAVICGRVKKSKEDIKVWSTTSRKRAPAERMWVSPLTDKIITKWE